MKVQMSGPTEKAMENLNEIIDLDRLNMAPVIEASGGTFDPERRRGGLTREIEGGAVFVVVRRDGELLGYLEYESEPGHIWHILSIQIHPGHQRGLVLRGLLSQFHDHLADNPPTALRTSVHLNNDASIQLHRGLGFVESAREQDRVLFRAQGGELCKRLRRFSKRG